MEYDEYHERMGTETTGRFDVTPLFTDSETFEQLRTDLLEDIPEKPTHVAGIDALGFILGSALAVDLDVGFVPIRKGGKLPYTDERLIQRELTDYTDKTKTLELDSEAVGEGDCVLLVDEWVETGAQMTAAAELVESAGATIDGLVSLCVPETSSTAPLFERYPVYSLK
jgi:adenine phosphoribosyltransferase